MKSLLIKNGTIYDGLGGKPFQGDLLIKGDKIAQIGEISDPADRIIDAQGLTVTPGFVDIHRHCDAKPLIGGNYGEVMLAQGITTTVVGNCGISLTPCSPLPGPRQEMRDFDEPVLGPAPEREVLEYRDYLDRLDRAELPVNFASMIGTGSIRITVKGFSNAPYTQAELEQSRALVRDAMEAGAAGISVGIMYLPECYGTAADYAEILKPVGEYGGVVTAHMRGEGDSLVESVREILEIGKLAGCAVEISHFKSCGMANWRREIHRAIELIDKARSAGQDVTCDFYPYDGGSTALTTMLPPAFVQGDQRGALERLGTAGGVKEFRESTGILYPDWDNYAVTLGWDRILISGVAQQENRKFIGKTVAECAVEFGFEDAAACAAHLMHSDGGRTAIINRSMCQDDIDTVARLPYSLVISDAIYADTDTPHPRMYGAFPKILREYVGERKLLTMEEAIRKMTSLPAARMRLEGRGVLKEGSCADINLFHPAEFWDNATYETPAVLAAGLRLCVINGQIALENGAVVSAACGRNLRAK